MNKLSNQNKKAWSYNAYDFWIKELGNPETLANDMLVKPEYYVRRHIEYLGDVNGKKIINPLGSCGKKAIPLALLNADVSIVDISASNKRYAKELAKYA